MVAVVLAGGTARRFGSDKLAAPVEGAGDEPAATLLGQTLAALPPDVAAVVVGPPRPTARPVRFVREEPPGGGPAAGLVAGLRAVLPTAPDAVLVVPADAPGSGPGAALLLERLQQDPGARAVVGVDPDGREQPLQLALAPSAAAELVRLAGPERGAHASARRLVLALDPPPVRLALPPAQLWDVDTPDQLRVWRLRTSPAVAAVTAAVRAVLRVRAPGAPPVVLALDGPSGAGKSTLAQAVRLALGAPGEQATVLEGDDFYDHRLPTLPADERDRLTGVEATARVIDWRRLRAEALLPLLDGRAASYRPFDWEAFDGRLGEPRVVPPAPVVLLEGVYAARPELADLVDLAVHLDVDPAVRAARLAARGGDDPGWVAAWERGERHYFSRIRPVSDFHLTLRTS